MDGWHRESCNRVETYHTKTKHSNESNTISIINDETLWQQQQQQQTTSTNTKEPSTTGTTATTTTKTLATTTTTTTTTTTKGYNRSGKEGRCLRCSHQETSWKHVLE